MAFTTPNDGEDAFLDMLLEDASPNNQEARLYTAISPAISETTVIGNVTEATFTGYSANTLTRATWNAASGGSKTYPQISWSPTSSQTVIGWYMTEAGVSVLLLVEAFAASRSLVNGDTLNLDITVSMD